MSEEEKISFNREAAEIGNRILSHCTDGAIINQTTQQLCYIYSSLGEKEKAIEYAKKLPNIGCTDTVVLGDLYEGEQQKTHLKRAIKWYTSIFWCALINLADLGCRNETMSDAERIEIMKRRLRFLNLYLMTAIILITAVQCQLRIGILLIWLCLRAIMSSRYQVLKSGSICCNVRYATRKCTAHISACK